MTPTRPYSDVESAAQELQNCFESLIRSRQVSWQMSYRLLRPLGSGGQGVVFLADRINPHNLSFRLALKFYRPDVYPDVESYQKDMARIARVAMTLSRPQQDHLLDVFNVVVSEGVQVVPMEWVDGIDLAHLLRPHMLELVREQVDDDRWAHVNDVIVTQARSQLRLQPGVASAILRDCLAGLASLHREGIVHADIKPANVMIKRTGTCKLIDFGSSFHVDDLPLRPTWTPRYAAVEVLRGAVPTPVSDLASLGYVFVEMLSGEYPFADAQSPGDLIAAKLRLPDALTSLLPRDVGGNKRLLRLVRRLIDPDPAQRFPSAEAAELGPDGASEFQKQLVKGNLSSEYANDIRLLLEEIE
ncbi:MAG: serine/threonine-protein kinase [Planctomycetaceae bacterium]